MLPGRPAYGESACYRKGGLQKPYQAIPSGYHTQTLSGIGHWAQDGLLTIFFLVVGWSLNRSHPTGSLSNPKAAAVPMLAAVGGMLLPPVIFIGAACAGTHLDLVHGVGFAVAAQDGLSPLLQI